MFRRGQTGQKRAQTLQVHQGAVEGRGESCLGKKEKTLSEDAESFQIQNLHGKLVASRHSSMGSCMSTWSPAGGASECSGTSRSRSVLSECGSIRCYVLTYFQTLFCFLITDGVHQLP